MKLESDKTCKYYYDNIVCKICKINMSDREKNIIYEFRSQGEY